MTYGSYTKFGRIIKVHRDGVIVDDGSGRYRKISFKKFKARYKNTKHLAA